MRFAKAHLLAGLTPLLLSPCLLHASEVDADGMVCFSPPKTTLYAEENFSSFPCDLSQGPTPKILIVGEVHAFVTLAPSAGQESSIKKAELAQEFWASVEAAAAEKQLILAGEDVMVSRDGQPFSGKFYTDSFQASPRFLGVEDGFAKTFTTLPIYLLMSQESIAMYERASDAKTKQQLLESLRYKMVALADTFWKSAYLQALWKRVPRPFGSPMDERFANTLDAHACDAEGINKATSLMAALTYEDLKSVYRVFQAALAELPDFLNEMKFNPTVPLDKTNFNAVVQRVHSEKQVNSETMHELLAAGSPLRDTMMVANLAKLYCALRSTGLNVIVKVGESHVKPLVAALKGRAEKSGLDAQLIREEYADQLALKLRSQVK